MSAGDAMAQAMIDLCSLPGPSGAEARVREHLRARWTPWVAALTEDGAGNMLLRVGGHGPRVLLVAHMDEIGFRVRAVDEGGALLLAPAQGTRSSPVGTRYPVGQPAVVLATDGAEVRGVFAAASGHVLAGAPAPGPLGYDDFHVDLGAESADQVAALGIGPGAPVVWGGGAARLRNRMVGKALDDRAMLAVLDRLLRDLDRDALAVELWIAATVQEENGMHGAAAVARAERFDHVIVLDVGLVGDVPGIAATSHPAVLGGGPILVTQDGSVAYNPELLAALASAADRHGVAHQHGAFTGYGSDGHAFVRAGMATALLTIPTRYTHTAFEMLDLTDAAACVSMLHAAVADPETLAA